MSRCGVNRWGPGTTCERPINTEAAKEIRERLAVLEAERKKQDQIWTQSEPTIKNSGSQTNTGSKGPKYTSS